MRGFLLTVFTCLSVFPLCAQSAFERGLLCDRTLRMDYTFCGNDQSASIYLDEARCFDGWAGRKVNMDHTPVRGNGQIVMTAVESGETLYCQSFSTLFQEWQATEEATHVSKSFENVFLLPMPCVPVEIKVVLFDFKNRESASLKHPLDPADILIRPSLQDTPDYRYLMFNGKDAIDVVFAAEGYTSAEKDSFYRDAQIGMEAILSYEPYSHWKEKFNFIAVFLESSESGVSIPHLGQWKKTAVGSHFDTFYTDRYLTTLQIKSLHNQLAGLPYEHLIILANTDNYGGGGIYHSYALTNTRHARYAEVLVHEFGHSFAALADEYYYDDQYVNYYYPGIEPWEPNITTMADFASKWKDMLGENGVSLYEGAGYQSKGAYRACEDCRMNTLSAPDFCPVCQRAIERMIHFQTKDLSQND